MSPWQKQLFFGSIWEAAFQVPTPHIFTLNAPNGSKFGVCEWNSAPVGGKCAMGELEEEEKLPTTETHCIIDQHEARLILATGHPNNYESYYFACK